MKELVDKQFQIEGIDYDFTRMFTSGIVEIETKGKKKSYNWYEIYRFSSEENYLKWKEFCLEKISIEEFIDMDFKYGMTYKYN